MTKWKTAGRNRLGACARALAVALLGTAACGEPVPAVVAPAVEQTPVAEKIPMVEPTAAGPPPANTGAVFEARIGLDLRALPRGTSAGGIDLFVGAQADRLRALAPAGAAVEVLQEAPGTGSLRAIFRAAGEVEAVALCEEVVAAYLEVAPRLPVIRTPAASLIVPCRPAQNP